VNSELDDYLEWRYEKSMRISLMARTLLAVMILVISVEQARPCNWARGYFYQLTRLQGGVVGAKLGPLQYSRRLRQAFTRNKVKLTLYEYRWPINARNDMPVMKTVDTDSSGKFDFGVLPDGHYALVLDDQNWGNATWFDVELKRLPKETATVVIDISPNFPDCQGGHEFIVKSK
jgi:hypothetical protein